MATHLTAKAAGGTLFSSVLAGALIALGGTVNLSIENRVVGACFFTIGLFFVVSMQLWLFTGKIGWLCRNGGAYVIQLLITLAGNFVGAGGVALLLRQTRTAGGLFSRAADLCALKLNDSLPSLFILAMFCGALMYFAVGGYQSITDAVGRYGAVFLAVTVFILSGFEHCIANIYYYTVAGIWGDSRAWLSMAVVVLGNAVGSVLVAELYGLAKKLTAPPKQNENRA